MDVFKDLVKQVRLKGKRVILVTLYLIVLTLALMVLVVLSPFILLKIIPELRRNWGAIQSQKAPAWLDSSLEKLLQDKTAKRNDYKTGIINSLYYYFHPRGRRGHVAWKQLEKIIDQYPLPEGYRPDAVIGIKSGGAFIANYLSRRLKVQEVGYIGVTNYNGKSLFERFETVLFKDYKNDKKCRITEFPKNDLRGKTVLLVDDQTATGASVKLAKEYLMSAGAKEVKVFCLYVHYADIDFFYARGFRLIWPWGIDA